MITQTTWRRAGALALAASALMAWFGTRPGAFQRPVPFLIIYWFFFLVFLLTALYLAVLDFRYIRMRYAMERRELFRQTLGSDDIRATVREKTLKHRNNGAGAAVRSVAEDKEPR